MPLDIGVDEGQQVYQYSLSGIGSPYLGLSGIICQGNLQFPSTGVELVASKMTIDCIFNGGSGAVSGTSRSFGSVIMDYVTVQAVSQPQTPVLGDINGDGAVDVQDLLCLANSFGTTRQIDGNYDPRCDFNSDDSVDAADLLTVVQDYWQH